MEAQFKYTPSWTPVYRGLELLTQQSYAEAIPLLSEALQLFPESIVLLEARVQAYISTKSLKLALQDALRIRDSNPNASNVSLMSLGSSMPNGALTRVTTGSAKSISLLDR